MTQTVVKQKYRILREVYRHYLEYRQFFSDYGRDIIDHGYTWKDDDGVLHKETVTLSFWDLQYGLKELSPRKREAFWYNVICDMKQKDVAKIMNITMVSVGQYVDHACAQLAKRYFAEEENEQIQVEV